MRPAKHIHLISSPIKPALLLCDPGPALLLMVRCCGGHSWLCSSLADAASLRV